MSQLDRDADGRAQVPFGLGTLSRSSGAWLPEVGKVYGNNVPRIVANRIPILQVKPRVFYSFDPSETAMAYDTTANNLLARMTAFETAFPTFTKVLIGQSFQTRNIYGYRLGADTQKHFVVVGSIHGDEVDGINGCFKAAELISTEAIFQPFLDEWSFFFIPTLNPDGWKAGTKHLIQTGPNGQTIDLNRNFDWNWADYVELPTESKGSAAGSTTEAQAILDYLNSGGPLGSPVPFGFLMVFRGNAQIGARYQTRDPVFRNILYGPGSLDTGEIPDAFLTEGLDYYIWRAATALSTRRLADTPTGRQYHARLFRRGFRTSLHGYFSGQGIPSIEVSEVKVTAAGGRETYASACDFRLDHILAAASCCTREHWSVNDGVLIEKSATNLLSNGQTYSFPSGDPVPTGYSEVLLDAEIERNDVAVEDGGPALNLASDTESFLPSAAEWLAAGVDQLGSCVVLLPNGNLRRFPFDLSEAATAITLSLHTTRVAAAIFYAGDGAVDVVGGGTAFETGASANVTRVTGLGTSAAEAAGGTITTARQHAGYCDNFLGLPQAADRRGYLWGGHNGASYLTSGGYWNPTTQTFSASTQSLGTAVAGLSAVYDPVSGFVYLFGGRSAGGMTATIYRLNPVTDTLTALAAVLPTACAYMAAIYSPSDKLIYLYGGEDGVGDMLTQTLAFDPITETISAVELPGNFHLDEATEDEDYSPQAIARGRWPGVLILEDAQDPGIGVLFGGRDTDSAGGLAMALVVHHFSDQVFATVDESVPAFLRNTTQLLDDALAVESTDDFTTLDEATKWTDTSGVWAGSGGKAVASGGTGPLKLQDAPDTPNQEIQLEINKDSVGPLVFGFGVSLRATYSGASLTDGYLFRYDGENDIWYLEKVVGSVVTQLDTYDASLDTDAQIDEVARTLLVSAFEDSPVKLRAVFNGIEILNAVDIYEDRILIAGIVALEGGGP